MKQNPTSDFQRCTTPIQRQCPTLKQRRNNVEFNWASDECEFVNKGIVFILLNEKMFFDIY